MIEMVNKMRKEGFVYGAPEITGRFVHAGRCAVSTSLSVKPVSNRRAALLPSMRNCLTSSTHSHGCTAAGIVDPRGPGPRGGAWAILKRHGCTRRIGTWCMLPPGCIRCGRGTRFAAGTGNFKSSRSRGTHMAVLLLQILRKRYCFPAILCKRVDQFTSSAVTAT